MLMNQASPQVGVVPRNRQRNAGDAMSALMEEEEEIYNAKVIFMGDPAVGKTSIIRTFMEGKPSLRPERTTMVSDFCRVVDVQLDGKKYRIKLNIWDAAGDGDVHNLAHLFVRDVQVGILVYGINS